MVKKPRVAATAGARSDATPAAKVGWTRTEKVIVAVMVPVIVGFVTLSIFGLYMYVTKGGPTEHDLFQQSAPATCYTLTERRALLQIPITGEEIFGINDLELVDAENARIVSAELLGRNVEPYDESNLPTQSELNGMTPAESPRFSLGEADGSGFTLVVVLGLEENADEGSAAGVRLFSHPGEPTYFDDLNVAVEIDRGGCALR